MSTPTMTPDGAAALPADLLTQVPMLAVKSKDPAGQIRHLQDVGHHIFDVKWDGVRALAYVVDGHAWFRNRRGVDTSYRYPELIAALQHTYPTGSHVLDGEIVVYNQHDGCFDFNLALKRDSQSNPTRIAQLVKTAPACFMVFDVLWRNQDLRGVPLVSRLDAVNEVGGDAEFKQVTEIRPSMRSEDGAALWEAAAKFCLEGLIAKDLRSRYVADRHMSWLKLKRLHRATCIATGYEPGDGARRGLIGSLIVQLIDPAGRLVDVGRVGSGLKRSDHKPMMELLDIGEQFLVEVEFLELTKDNRLRQPTYKGVRSDIARDDCTLAQVTTRTKLAGTGV